MIQISHFQLMLVPEREHGAVTSGHPYKIDLMWDFPFEGLRQEQDNHNCKTNEVGGKTQ